jgi:hypothetical protein
MKKFLVLHLAPVSVVDEWKRSPADKRKAAEEKMQQEWRQWLSQHKQMFADMGAGAGKTKRVTAQGTSDTRNDVMMYSIVQADSQEAAARSFVGHPHLQIPQSSIEIMELQSLPEM